MRIKNYTKVRIPRKWLQKVMDELGVNPSIKIFYADNPEEIEIPNCLHPDGYYLDGEATNYNEVFIYVGKWSKGNFITWTNQYFRWVAAHELFHQYHYYMLAQKDKWRGLDAKEKIRREEISCSNYASRIVGVPGRDYKIYKSADRV